MTFDVETAHRQVQKLNRLSSDVAYIDQKLGKCESELRRLWSASETRYFEEILMQLRGSCIELEKELKNISRDMVQAVEDIVAEEAEAAASAALGGSAE